MYIWNRSGIPEFASYLGMGAEARLFYFSYLSYLGEFLGFSKVNFCWYLSQQRAFDTIGLESSC